MTAGNRIPWLWRLLAPLGVLLAVGVHSNETTEEGKSFLAKTYAIGRQSTPEATFPVVWAYLGWAQVDSSADTHYEQAESVELDRVGGPVLAQRERVTACLANHQWDEAVTTICQVMDKAGDKLSPIAKNRYISVRDWCHLELTGWPHEALALYRSRVDPLAEKWYRDGIARRDPQPLLQVVEEAFASSWGDDALAALGEMALEDGDFDSARAYWEKILPPHLPPTVPVTLLRFPNTKLDIPTIHAWLVLASILEGSIDRARRELDILRASYFNAQGQLAGHQVDLAEALEKLLTESQSWPEVPQSADWLTFAGTPWRNKIAPQGIDVRDVAWRVRFREQVADIPSPAASARNSSGVADENENPLSFHPVLSGGLVLLNTRETILALDARTGKPAWDHGAGVIYRNEPARNAVASSGPLPVFGTPRFTMTVCDDRLYARMGSPITSQPAGSSADVGQDCLVCLDLRCEGRLLWKVGSGEPAWAFEGSPVCDGRKVYIAMRRSDIRPQAHVACFDAETGQRRWRRFICSAGAPASDVSCQVANNLLTLKRDVIYYNTNLGAVAALSTREGAVRWITLYPRAARGSLARPAPYAHRDLTPCLAHRGMLLVAPADNPRVLALDSATGEILWQTGDQVEDVVHLLGAVGDQLIASGQRLYWISLKSEDAGQIRHMWPEGDADPGYGRGVLAADRVYFPTRQQIYVFDQASARSEGVIDLADHSAGGGNLLAYHGGLLIATGRELIALGGRNSTPP